MEKSVRMQLQSALEHIKHFQSYAKEVGGVVSPKEVQKLTAEVQHLITSFQHEQQVLQEKEGMKATSDVQFHTTRVDQELAQKTQKAITEVQQFIGQFANTTPLAALQQIAALNKVIKDLGEELERYKSEVKKQKKKITPVKESQNNKNTK